MTKKVTFTNENVNVIYIAGTEDEIRDFFYEAIVKTIDKDNCTGYDLNRITHQINRWDMFSSVRLARCDKNDDKFFSITIDKATVAHRGKAFPEIYDRLQDGPVEIRRKMK